MRVGVGPRAGLGRVQERRRVDDCDAYFRCLAHALRFARCGAGAGQQDSHVAVDRRAVSAAERFGARANDRERQVALRLFRRLVVSRGVDADAELGREQWSAGISALSGWFAAVSPAFLGPRLFHLCSAVGDAAPLLLPPGEPRNPHSVGLRLG